MGQALYRKYRSRSLAEVVGQEHITQTLERALQAGHISHAYLFTGPHGVGKTSVARILAHQMNDLPYSDTPHLDIIEIDAASNRRIDDIRDLREKVHIAPVSAKYKVYIIDEVHMLTGESFNALLKTLEEPPAHVVFILATTEVHKLPATIISRTQRFTFRPGSKEKMVTHLQMIAQKEGITIDDDALGLVADHGAGSFRDSVSLLDQLAHISTGPITAHDVASTLGLAPREQLDQLLQAVLSGDHQRIAASLADLEQQGAAASALVGQLTGLLREQAIHRPSVYSLIDRLLDVPHAYNPSLKLLTTLVSFAPPKPETPKATPVTMAEPTVIATKPTSVPAAKDIQPAPQATEPAAPVQPLTNLPLADWQQVLADIKTRHAPLFAVLKHAQPVVQDDGALILKFKFPLHSKKFDDPKQKALVAEAIQRILGKTPTIQAQVDKSAVPPPQTSDPIVASVATIMGGGEIVNAETI